MHRPDIFHTLQEKYGERLPKPLIPHEMDSNTKSYLLRRIVSRKPPEEVIFIQGLHTVYHYKPESNKYLPTSEFPNPKKQRKSFISNFLSRSDEVYIIEAEDARLTDRDRSS